MKPKTFSRIVLVQQFVNFSQFQNNLSQRSVITNWERKKKHRNQRLLVHVDLHTDRR